MAGRGIDQILPWPGNPILYEQCVNDAREYVMIAEELHGSIPQPTDFKYIWGDAFSEMAKADVRVINMETSITSSNDCWPDKGIHYRMHPRNIGCLTAANINACSLANNHVLDWGYVGLKETIEVLDRVGIAHSGAGENSTQASAPAVVNLADKRRVLLFSMSATSSGIPWEWSADEDQPGVNLLEDLSEKTAARISEQMRIHKQPGDLAIASIHWGSNWGYEIPNREILFAHRLIEEGFDIIHGHSSHHVKGIELYQGRLILYGCGDFINDYEGITGNEEFRSDLALVYLMQMDSSNHLATSRLVPMQMRRFQLHHASTEDAQWLCKLMNQLSAPFDTQVQPAEDNTLIVR